MIRSRTAGSGAELVGDERPEDARALGVADAAPRLVPAPGPSA